MSARGRNLLFINAIADALQLDTEFKAPSLANYKRAFTPQAVKKIYQAVTEIWPRDADIQSILERGRSDVSGLYIGDYSPAYLSRAIVRHSIYANKILLIDPFQHPYVLSPSYNPLRNPDQYRAQTLKNVNFYFSMIPWIQAGIVEFVRTPADFDRKLNFESMQRAEVIGDSEELKGAKEESISELRRRHSKNETRRMAILSVPDSNLRRVYNKIVTDKESVTEEGFIKFIQDMRDRDPNFLEPLGAGPNNSQLHMMFSGGTHEMAALTAQMAGSYLFTDLKIKWALIESDRSRRNADAEVWSPFAKAVQDTRLNYLNALSLEHALKLRNEGRLENLRSFLNKVWQKARGDSPFDDRVAIELANELTAAVGEAEAEWHVMRKDLVKFIGGAGAVTNAISAGAAIASGSAMWLAAGALASSLAGTLWMGFRRKEYDNKYPAAFFMDLQDE